MTDTDEMDHTDEFIDMALERDNYREAIKVLQREVRDMKATMRDQKRTIKRLVHINHA